ncbi:hypothetical protein OSB04_027014 [Centaurea solstitialis]|uniref:Syndetin n=1 Tax=Centaurea solstitialis TaxID=347529 RepID=A0AA38SDS9_9ASTR|nr:hypothetical protein OSB04_027014 [Centaurea solstitialis]
MQPSSFSLTPPLALIPLALNQGNFTTEGFEISRFLFLGSLLLSPGGGDTAGGGMDLSKVGEKFLSSVRSARSLGFLPSTSDRPEVPERAAAAATIARALASIPPHQRQNISSSSQELSSIYGSEQRDQVLEELEEEFYEEDASMNAAHAIPILGLWFSLEVILPGKFLYWIELIMEVAETEEFDPVQHALENIPSEEKDHAYFEEKAALRLLQLDKVTESLSRQVMEHHEVMVKGMDLVGELEKDLKVANVICMNGRRHLTSSRNEVSRDLIVNTCSRRKQSLLEVLLVLKEVCRAKHMQMELETHVNEDNFCKAFQVLSEYLQVLDSLSELSAVQEMSRGVEVRNSYGIAVETGKEINLPTRLGVTDIADLAGKSSTEAGFTFIRCVPRLQRNELFDCFFLLRKHSNRPKVVDAYALIGDVSGLAEKIQSFFMQEVISETHAVLKSIVLEDVEAADMQSTRLTYSDLCTRIPESKYRQCLLETLAVLFKLMGSYYTIMSFHSEFKAGMCSQFLSDYLHVSILIFSSIPYVPLKNFSSSKHSPLPLASMGQVSHEVQKQADETGSSKNVQQAGSLSQYSSSSEVDVGFPSQSVQQEPSLALGEEPLTSAIDESGTGSFTTHDPSGSESRDDGSGASSSGSPWFQLRSDATVYVSQTLQRGRNYLWQLATSRVSVLLSSAAVSSASIHQFLKIYEDLNIFILAGEAFCGTEAVEFRQKVKAFCENYYIAFHRQNIQALKMVLEKESWFMLPPETIQVVSFAGLVGDGAALISQTATSSHKSAGLMKTGPKQGGFSHWIRSGNPFCSQDDSKCDGAPLHGVSAVSEELNGKINGASHRNDPSRNSDANPSNGHADASEDENEDLLADFIDEDSQLPSRTFKPKHSSNHTLPSSSEDMRAHTGSSICVLRLMDKYARLMQRLEIINVELFKGICQLFGIFFYFVFESFGHQNTNPGGKGNNEALTYRLKTALSRIYQDCGQWIKSSSPSDSFFSHSPMNMPFSHMDITPTPPSANSSHIPGTSFGLKERCAGADTISLVAHLLYKFKAHLQSILLMNNATVLEEFYSHLVHVVLDMSISIGVPIPFCTVDLNVKFKVDSVPDLTQQIHRTTAKLLFHISGYADRIASAKWEVKELGMEHNGYVDLLLGEFKHYRTRLAHGGIRVEVQDLLIEYGLETISETLVEGLSRVKRCSDEGRALMLLDLQVLINGLQHFVTVSVKPKLQAVETFIKAYYLPETEYVHWARAHPVTYSDPKLFPSSLRIHEKPNGGADQPCGYNERLEKENQIGSIGKDRVMRLCSCSFSNVLVFL